VTLCPSGDAIYINSIIKLHGDQDSFVSYLAVCGLLGAKRKAIPFSYSTKHCGNMEIPKVIPHFSAKLVARGRRLGAHS
jgi:hypothetical protein